MKKKAYLTPTATTYHILLHQLMQNSPGQEAHGDDPQNPGNAMTRRRNVWDDEEEEDY